MVELHLAKVVVAGSIPVSRSSEQRRPEKEGSLLFFYLLIGITVCHLTRLSVSSV